MILSSSSSPQVFRKKGSFKMISPPDTRDQNRQKKGSNPTNRRPTRHSDAELRWLRFHIIGPGSLLTILPWIISLKWYSHKQVDLPRCNSIVYSFTN